MFPSYYYEKRRKKRRMLILIGCIFVLLFTFVILFFSNESPPVADVLMQTKDTTLQKTATLKLTTLYTCGHQKNRLLPLPENLNDQTKTKVAELHPDWTILRFEEQCLEAEEKVDTVCDNHFEIKLLKNKIAVSRKNTPNEIIMEEKINPSVLTNEDKKILTAGISVNSEYELLEILESFR